MASEISTIQSLKAVDAWIDVINANINGGVRTGFKSSRLKFTGSNTDIVRTGTASSLPLQFPEPGLTTANTVIDFAQGAITASTENTHLAVQGEGFFVVASPNTFLADGTPDYGIIPQWKFLLTRDGEFRTRQDGLLVNNFGYILMAADHNVFSAFWHGPTMRPVYNNMDLTTNAVAGGPVQAVRLTDFVANQMTTTTVLADGVSTMGNAGYQSAALHTIPNKQDLTYSTYGSTHFEMIFTTPATTNLPLQVYGGTSSILTKSLEASNASMTQSVPELSLAQKLFSALTKVLQTKQTNVDGVLNLVR